MKRLVLAAGLALAFHAVLFYGGWDPLGKGKRVERRPRQIHLSLSYLPPPSKTPTPAVEKKTTIPAKVLPKQEQPKKPPKQVKRLASPKKPAKMASKKPEPVMKPESVMKAEPSPPPTIEQEPLVPTTSALPTSLKEEPSPELQEEEKESPSFEVSETFDTREPVTELTSAIPLYRRNPAPKYPRIAKRKGYEGKVVLDVLVNREGKVESLVIFRSSGHTILDKAAQKAVASWLFSPATKGKERIAMWIKVPIRFDLQ